MFDKVKQAGNLIKMRGEAQKLQKKLRTITETYNEGGVLIKMNGANEVEYVEIDGKERRDVVEGYKKVSEKIQRKAAEEMMRSGGGISGLLGKMGQ